MSSFPWDFTRPQEPTRKVSPHHLPFLKFFGYLEPVNRWFWIRTRSPLFFFLFFFDFFDLPTVGNQGHCPGHLIFATTRSHRRWLAQAFPCSVKRKRRECLVLRKKNKRKGNRALCSFLLFYFIFFLIYSFLSLSQFFSFLFPKDQGICESGVRDLSMDPYKP